MDLRWLLQRLFRQKPPTNLRDGIDASRFERARRERQVNNTDGRILLLESVAKAHGWMDGLTRERGREPSTAGEEKKDGRANRRRLARPRRHRLAIQFPFA